MASPPKVDAFLLCEHVHRDAVTGKHTLLGLWDAMRAAEFPAFYARCGVYFNLTGLNGTHRFAITLVAPDLTGVVTRIEIGDVITVNDPLRRHEIGFNLPGLSLPMPGRYTLRLLYNDLVVAEFTLTAIKTS